MLLTLSVVGEHAAELGFLLHKHPAKLQSFSQSCGVAHVFYPDSDAERCTVALLVEVDPIGLVRNRRGSEAGPLMAQYVNDRPYVASSFLSVALGDVFRSALNGRCADRPHLVETPLDLEVRVPALPSRGGEALLRALFEPLGYRLEARRLALDPLHAQWGEAACYDTTLCIRAPLQRCLQHLYVLIPVLDNEKHYWVGAAEVDKLLRHAQDWLGSHPARDDIVRRYLKHKRSLARIALERLLEAEGEQEEDDVDAPVQSAAREAALERGISLNQQRIEAVTQTIAVCGASSVIDLGCGEGKLLGPLLKLSTLQRVSGLDVSHRALENAQDRLNLDRLPAAVRAKLTLLHGALTYRDARMHGYDVATVIEVIEHLDPPRLSAFQRVLFEFARPRRAIVTTPNIEYNVKFPSLPATQLRHPDHRFEWTRGEFELWCRQQCERFGYDVEIRGIGEADEVLGHPTQMAIFHLQNA